MADLLRRGIDPTLIDTEPDATLPEAMQGKLLMLELTELFLDGRFFYQHAGSQDHVDAYREALASGLQAGTISTPFASATLGRKWPTQFLGRC